MQSFWGMKKYFVLLVLGVLIWSGLACGRSGESPKESEIVVNDETTMIQNQVLQPHLIQSSKSMGIVAKRALVIGLGQQKDGNWGKINGDKDVPYVHKMLKDAGYKDIRTLINKQATKAGIVMAFKSLTKSCQKGDIIYIHFSGHGQQVTDVNGDEWPDTLDEAWIPYDAYLIYGKNDKGEKHLIDDEINVMLTDIKNKIGEQGKLLVVVDACHSGDSSRGDDLDETVRGVYDEFVIPVKKKARTNKPVEQWLTLSACKDYQLNQELKSPQVGKLTYALYMLSKDGALTIEAIDRFMKRYRSRLPQAPVLTGVKNYGLSDILR